MDTTTTQTVTLNEIIDQAALQMRPAQRRRHERRMSIPGYREMFAAELRDELLEDARLQPIVGSATITTFQAENFTAETPFQIDTSKLRELLDLALEYAPKIIDLIMLLLKLF